MSPKAPPKPKRVTRYSVDGEVVDTKAAAKARKGDLDDERRAAAAGRAKAGRAELGLDPPGRDFVPPFAEAVVTDVEVEVLFDVVSVGQNGGPDAIERAGLPTEELALGELAGLEGQVGSSNWRGPRPTFEVRSREVPVAEEG